MEVLFTILVLILSVIIHEVAHGYAALWQGDPTAKYAGRLTLDPIKHLDLVGSIIVPALLIILPTNFILGWAKPVPINPYNFRDQKWGEAKVSFAGPLSNILIALLFGLLIRLGLQVGFLDLSGQAVIIMGLIVLINLVLAIFNLIPIPPLDGSKILFAFLPMDFSRARLVLEQYGLLILFLALFVFGTVLFGIINIALMWGFTLATGEPNLLGKVIETFFSF